MEKKRRNPFPQMQFLSLNIENPVTPASENIRFSLMYHKLWWMNLKRYLFSLAMHVKNWHQAEPLFWIISLETLQYNPQPPFIILWELNAIGPHSLSRYYLPGHSHCTHWSPLLWDSQRYFLNRMKPVYKWKPTAKIWVRLAADLVLERKVDFCLCMTKVPRQTSII